MRGLLFLLSGLVRCSIALGAILLEVDTGVVRVKHCHCLPHLRVVR